MKPSKKDLVDSRKLALEWILNDQILDKENPDYGGFWDAYYPDIEEQARREIGDMIYRQPYMEVVGFTLPTLVECSRLLDEAKYLRSADLCVEEWFKKRLQYKGKDKLAYGALKHNSFTPIYFAFDNAQALRGALSVYRATGKEDQLELAKDIARWEMEIMQNPDGSFKLRYEQEKDKVLLSKEVYQARVCWGLAELWRETGEEAYREAAERGLSWVLSQQHENGWLTSCQEYSLYAIEGLYFGGKIFSRKEFVEAARKGIDAFLKAPRNEDGSLYYHYNSDFTPQISVMERAGQWGFYSADGQLARLCYYIFKDSGEKRYLEEGDSILEMLYSLQEKESENPCIRGGIRHHGKGDTPWHTRLPIWTVKYFVDIINLRLRL